MSICISIKLPRQSTSYHCEIQIDQLLNSTPVHHRRKGIWTIYWRKEVAAGRGGWLHIIVIDGMVPNDLSIILKNQEEADKWGSPGPLQIGRIYIEFQLYDRWTVRFHRSWRMMNRLVPSSLRTRDFWTAPTKNPKIYFRNKTVLHWFIHWGLLNIRRITLHSCKEWGNYQNLIYKSQPWVTHLAICMVLSKGLLVKKKIL